MLMRYGHLPLFLFLTISAVTTTEVGSSEVNPRIFRISAKSLRDAGFEHGKLAKDLIHEAFQLPEFESMRAFVSVNGSGKVAFENLKRDNTAHFPGLVEEIVGTAEGAEVSVDDIWMANMVTEIESLMKEQNKNMASIGHCSDIYAHNGRTIAHGHNEDWSVSFKPYWYILSYSALPGANFSSCAGMAYPGTMVGFAATWNAHGVYSTQNTLFPQPTRAYGLASTLAQRIANCGPVGTGPFPVVNNIDEFANLLHTKDWAASASLNVVDLNHQRMSNIEVYEDSFSRYDAMANYSHFNMFKHLAVGENADQGDDSTRHRQARVNEIAIPHSVQDIVRILGDTKDSLYPLYRDITLSTLVLNGENSQLDVWIDENPSFTTSRPYFSFNLRTFFTAETGEVATALV